MSDAATIDVEAVRERVARGARLLDEAVPDWTKRVALDALAMERCDRCVLGQVHGSYDRGIRTLFFAIETRSGREQAVRDYGFEAKMGLPTEYADLADAWRAEIRARIAEGSARP